MAHTNGIESVWAVLKRGYNGTFHHMSGKHLQRYVDEFSFRLNDGNCQIDTIDRMTSLAANIGGKRLTYKELNQVMSRALSQRAQSSHNNGFYTADNLYPS